MDRVVALDPKARTVTVEAGVTYGRLCPYLHEKGFALHNLASLPHISVAGACATATHGSGVKNGNLATAVSALEFVTADGDVLTLSREKDGDTFLGAVVHLGALGVVTRVTLDVQPTFLMRQDVYENLPLAQLADHFEEIMSSGYSVSLFTDWQKKRINEVWIKRRVDGRDRRPPIRTSTGRGSRPGTSTRSPNSPAENCTEQMGVPGPWYERLPHFRMGFTPSSGKELQSEYFVPRKDAVEAILAVERLRDRVSPHLQISELRTIAADRLWMSPCYERPSLAIHFTWKPEWDAVRELMPVIEKELAPYEARPHWGKLFAMEPRATAISLREAGGFQATCSPSTIRTGSSGMRSWPGPSTADRSPARSDLQDVAPQMITPAGRRSDCRWPGRGADPTGRGRSSLAGRRGDDRRRRPARRRRAGPGSPGGCGTTLRGPGRRWPASSPAVHDGRRLDAGACGLYHAQLAGPGRGIRPSFDLIDGGANVTDSIGPTYWFRTPDGRAFCLPPGTSLVVGRSTETADVAFPDNKFLSRQHCRLVNSGGVCTIESVSRFWASINGREAPSNPATLQVGDTIELFPAGLILIVGLDPGGPSACPGGPHTDIDREFDRIFDAGIATAQEAWIDAIGRGFRDPVAILVWIDESSKQQIDVRVGERQSLAEYIAETYPEAAECLRRGSDPGCPMTIVAEYRGVVKIADRPDPRELEADD